MTLTLFAEHVHPEEARKNKKEKEQNGYGRSLVAAVNYSTYVSILVEIEKNAHDQINAMFFAVTIVLSGQAGGELCLFKKLSQSVRRLTNLQVREFFVFNLSSLSSVFVCCYCRYGMSVTISSEWSTLNGLCRCILMF